MSLSKFIFVILLNSLSLFPFCQEIKSIPVIHKLTLANGLSSYNVRKVVTDKLGFVWIATQDGLNKYDGRKFVYYNKDAKWGYKLEGNDVWDVAEDSIKNLLWVITAYGGINAIDLEKCKVAKSINLVTKPEIFPDGWLKCMTLCEDNLWIGTHRGLTVYNTVNNNLIEIDPLPFEMMGNDYSIDKLVVDANRNVWVFVLNFGIAVYSGKDGKILSSCKLNELMLSAFAGPIQFKSVSALNENSFLVATTSGLRIIRIDKTYTFKVIWPLVNDDHRQIFKKTVLSCFVDRSHNVWFSTEDGLFKTNGEFNKIVQIKDSYGTADDWLKEIYSISTDTKNTLWLGCVKGAVFLSLNEPPFMPVRGGLHKGLLDHLYSLIAISDSILFACNENNLVKIDLYKGLFQRLESGKSFQFVKQFEGNYYIIGTKEGTFLYDPQIGLHSISRFFPELYPLDKIDIRSLVPINDSLVVFGCKTPGGYYIWDKKNKSLVASKGIGNSEWKNIVNALYKDKRNAVWALSHNSISVFNYLNSSFEHFQLPSPENHQPLSLLFDMCEVGGYLWIAAYGTGIVQVDSLREVKEIFSEKHGLNNTGVYRIFPIGDSLLVLTTNNGLSLLNIKTKRFRNFFETDGLHGNSFEQDCGFYRNGLIYAGGLDGFTIINTANIRPNTYKPDLYISNIVTKTSILDHDTSDIELTKLSIPNNFTQVTLTFSAINFVAPEKTTFSYKINQLHKDWINLGTQNFVNLIGLSPGTYKLQVQAFNEDGVPSDIKEIKLIFLPKWYQTLWFKLLMIIITGAILYGLYRFRITQIRKEERVRRRLASDLHDDIGSTLSSISYYSEAIRKKVKDDKPEVIPLLDKMEKASDNTVDAMSDIVWAINPELDKGANLISRMHSYAAEMTGLKDINLVFDADPSFERSKLDMNVKKNLYLVFKEAVNNAVKYSECKNIHVKLFAEKDSVLMTIKDDGKGFDTSNEFSGNGLKNMQLRAKEIKADLVISSEQNKGCSVILKM